MVETMIGHRDGRRLSTHAFIGFGGVELVADIYGRSDHPAILMLPGATQTRGVWRKSAQALAEAGRYVICVDLRGHGDSTRPSDGNYALDAFVSDIIAILAQLPSRPVIIGSTFGGWLALAAISEADSPIATGLVLTNPFRDVHELTEDALQKEVDREVERNRQNQEFDPKIYDGGFDFRALQDRMRKGAARLPVPTLIVRGARDELSTPESAASLLELFANAELAEIEDGGHYVAFDQNEEFNAQLLAFLEQHVPRNSPEYQSGSDDRTLRNAMGCFASGITVLTTRAEDDVPVGLTVNSFSSVSLDPPLVMVCLAKTANSLPAFQTHPAFAINVLHIGQQPISNRFAKNGGDRFALTEWEAWDQNVPIISDSLASFECQRVNEIEQGDHIILIGQVTRARFEPRKDPLLYFSGQYRRLHLG